MKSETAEWVEKAEGDFRTAARERNSDEYPNYDAACFHAQQCAEKYLKARLVEPTGISRKRTTFLRF
jgi:HEPN domain-containing protein